MSLMCDNYPVGIGMEKSRNASICFYMNDEEKEAMKFENRIKPEIDISYEFLKVKNSKGKGILGAPSNG